MIRFVSISLFYLFKYKGKEFKEQLNEILILTFGGVKGTVSLATIFILPFTINQMIFYQRSLLLFLTAGVILVTLIVGIVVLPLLTETEEVVKTDLNALMILEEVIEVLKSEIKTLDKDSKEYLATEAVIENYQERIRDRSAVFFRSSLLKPRTLGPNSTFPMTVSHGKSAVFWYTTPRSGAGFPTFLP